MGHCINAIILKGDYDDDLAKEHDLIGKDLGFNLTLFHIDHYFTAYWQFKLGKKGRLEIPPKDNYLLFPTEIVLADLMQLISKHTIVEFALIETSYFGSVGNQFASVYKDKNLVSEEFDTINKVLNYLGVVSKEGFDEFDTVGLNNIRSQPDDISESYMDFLDEHNL